jgi:SAM-dependent methyltransferase
VEGVAEKLPLADNCFDIAFMSSVVHHFSDLKLAFSESNRVLRGGGQLGVRFATQTQLRRRIDCRFFSSLQRLFAERPDLEDVKQAMLEAGFRNLRQREVKELFVCSKTEYLRKILLVHSSAIEQLPHLEYQAGLDEAKQYLSSHELLEEDKYDFMTFLTGEKP